jgi:hypothetical protein
MNHDLTPTSVGSGGDDGALSRGTGVSLEGRRRGDLAEQPGRGLVAAAVMVWAPQDHLDANEIHTVG